MYYSDDKNNYHVVDAISESPIIKINKNKNLFEQWTIVPNNFYVSINLCSSQVVSVYKL